MNENTEPTSPAPCDPSLDAWRLEVDQIIARIGHRTRSAPPGERTADAAASRGGTATLVVPHAPEFWEAAELAATEPGLPCNDAPLQPAKLPEDDTDQVTSPAHPATQASLRSACVKDAVEPRSQLPASARQGCLREAGTPPPNSALLREVVEAATTVHKTLGPGFWQHVYTQCLAHELTLRGLATERNVPVAVDYKGNCCVDAFQITLRVAGSVIVEVKATDRILPTHEAQLRNFLLRSGAHAALLINFHEPDITKAIRTIDWTAV